MKCLLKLAAILGISGAASLGCFALRAETLSFTDPNVTKPGAISPVAWQRPMWLDNYADIQFDNLGIWQVTPFYQPNTGRVYWLIGENLNLAGLQIPPPPALNDLVGHYGGPIYHLHKGYYSHDGLFSFVALKNGTCLLKIEVEGQRYYAQGRVSTLGFFVDSLSTVLQHPNRAPLELQLFFALHSNNSVTCAGILSNGSGCLQLSGQRAR